MNKLEKLFFPHRVQEKIPVFFLTEMDVHETALCHHAHIYIKQDLSNSKYNLEDDS